MVYVHLSIYLIISLYLSLSLYIYIHNIYIYIYIYTHVRTYVGVRDLHGHRLSPCCRVLVWAGRRSCTSFSSHSVIAALLLYHATFSFPLMLLFRFLLVLVLFSHFSSHIVKRSTKLDGKHLTRVRASFRVDLRSPNFSFPFLRPLRRSSLLYYIISYKETYCV